MSSRASRPALFAGILLCASLHGQVVLHSDPYATSGGSAYKNVVRDSAGRLHALSVRETPAGDRELILHSSEDGGTSWVQDPFVLNDATSGLNPPNATTNCALAIDGGGLLHIIWGRYYYPSYYQQYYRNYDPVTGNASAIVNLSDTTGAVPTSRTAAMDLTVDADDTVWLAAHGPSSWVERLLRSTMPSAADLTFEDIGNISPGNSAQNSRLAVASDGRIHCSYYRNVAPGNYEHRIYDPSLQSWEPATTLGNTIAPNDYYGALSADLIGNVHALFVVDATSGSTLWQFLYRRWDATSGWGDPVTLFEATTDQQSGIANYRIFALACDEMTGDVSAVYRDLSNGAPLRLAEKGLTDSAFSFVEDLQPASSGLHEYYVPTLRGTLYPDFNRTGSNLHITFQNRPAPAPPFSFVFQTTGAGPQILRGDADGNGTFSGLVDGLFVLNYQFVAGAPEPPCLKAADADDSGSFQGLLDGLYILNYQFVVGSPPPPPPGPSACGNDPTADSLTCVTPSCP